MDQPKNSKYHVSLPLILCIGLAGGLLIGASINSKSSKPNDNSEIEKLREVLALVQNEYVDKGKTDAVVEDAINHILGKLDPHSAYIAARDKVEANEDLRGNFEGIGIEFNIFHDTLVVIAALPGGPSEAVGLRPGDRIVKVNDKVIASTKLTNFDVQKYLKGPKGTEVKIEVLRKKKKSPILFTIVRDKIPQTSVDATYMIDKETGYIKISRFSQTTYEEFKKGLDRLKSEGMKKLILDLQNNPGGYMDQAIDVADEFLAKGEKIVFTQGQESRYNENAVATEKGDFEKGDLIVLVNEYSASAAEIVTGALQDNDRALVVGRRSYGKGLVQRPFDLNDGSDVRLTISRYYTPSGRSIQKPYGDLDAYDKDITKRYKHGEFFHADSIHFNDSLKYHTLNGRTVYGGGGIMPDYFVPLDTTHSSKYFTELFAANSIREYAFNYAEENKSRLEQMGYPAYKDKFVVDDRMLNRLVAMGERENVKANPSDLARNKSVFQIYLKAEIARRVWGNSSAFPIFNNNNEVLQQVIKSNLFDKVPELDRSKF